jgi:hypothetical protein
LASAARVLARSSVPADHGLFSWALGSVSEGLRSLRAVAVRARAATGNIPAGHFFNPFAFVRPIVLAGQFHVNLANPISNLNALQSSGGSIDPITGQIINPGDFGRVTSTAITLVSFN